METEYMKVSLYEYFITNKNGSIDKGDKKMIEFVEQLKKVDSFNFNQNEVDYLLRKPMEENGCVLLHYYQASDINRDNFRHENSGSFDYLTSEELKDIKEVKHIFIFIDITTRKLYMNHVFKTMEIVRKFIKSNSQVFSDHLNIKSVVDENSIDQMLKYINSIEFKSVKEDILFNLIDENMVTDLVRDEQVKSVNFKISYKYRIKRLDNFIKKYITSGIRNKSEVILNFTDGFDNSCVLNTKKLMKSITIGTYGLTNEEEEENARKNIFLRLKDLRDK